MTTRDPYSEPPSPGEAFSPKVLVLQFIEEQKRGLARLQRAMRAQTEVLNDATRAAVYRELIADLKKQSGEAKYAAAYGEASMGDLATRLDSWADYLSKYGWAEKYTTGGEPKVPTLEDKIDDAYIRFGAGEVAKLFAR